MIVVYSGCFLWMLHRYILEFFKPCAKSMHMSIDEQLSQTRVAPQV